MRVKAKHLSENQRIETLDALYTSAGTLQGRDSAKKFLRNLLTESERIMLGRRILIARELLMGATHDQVVEKYKVGKDTTLRISRWLDDQLPGYEDVIFDMEKELEKRKKRSNEKHLFATSALYRLKKKYPLHFLLFPTPKK
jgi:uncharacterized protein YerC